VPSARDAPAARRRRRVMRTRRPAVRCGRTPRSSQAILQTALSFSRPSRAGAPSTRDIAHPLGVKDHSIGGRSPFVGPASIRLGRVRRDAGLGVDDVSVISSAMRASRSVNPAGVTCAWRRRSGVLTSPGSRPLSRGGVLTRDGSTGRRSRLAGTQNHRAEDHDRGGDAAVNTSGPDLAARIRRRRTIHSARSRSLARPR